LTGWLHLEQLLTSTDHDLEIAEISKRHPLSIPAFLALVNTQRTAEESLHEPLFPNLFDLGERLCALSIPQ